MGITSTSPALNMIVIYSKDVQRLVTFYQTYFGFTPVGEAAGDLVELQAGANSASLLIHKAGKAVRLGQASVKLVFSVNDVDAFKAAASELGLDFGSTHYANGYDYANAKDPDGNSISISSRLYRLD